MSNFEKKPFEFNYISMFSFQQDESFLAKKLRRENDVYEVRRDEEQYNMEKIETNKNLLKPFINASEIRYSGMIHCINEMTNKEFSAIDVLNSPKRKLIEYRYGTIRPIKKFIEKYKDYLH